MERKNLTLDSVQLKFTDGSRRFSGYASVFGGVDSYGDTIKPGAYSKTIGNRDRPIQMRWNHFGPVIGKWLEIREDEKGLFVEGELTPGHSVAEDAYSLLKHGAVTGMSIGYRIPENGSEKNEHGGRLLKEIDLVEISIVESPADNSAHVSDVKNAIDAADTPKEFEHLLRDVAGFSVSEAKAFVSRLKTVCCREGDTKSDEIKESIKDCFENFKFEPLRSNSK